MLDLDVILTFFTDTLSGYVYIITTVISILVILGIIGFLSERKFNLENNGILTKTYHKEEEMILGDRTLYSDHEEIIAPVNSIPNSNTQAANHQDEVL